MDFFPISINKHWKKLILSRRREARFHDEQYFILFAASGSGSVIGRDPLPPRAVSTSQLAQRTQTQPPATVSTLPLPRSNATHRQPLPLHQSTPQSVRQSENDASNSTQLLRVASNGDIGTGSAMWVIKNFSFPWNGWEKKKKLRRARVESREKGYVKLFFNKKKNWKKFDFEIIMEFLS